MNNNHSNYKESHNATKNVIRQYNRSHDQNIARNIKHDNKSFYAYIRSKQMHETRLDH